MSGLPEPLTNGLHVGSIVLQPPRGNWKLCFGGILRCRESSRNYKRPVLTIIWLELLI